MKGGDRHVLGERRIEAGDHCTNRPALSLAVVVGVVAVQMNCKLGGEPWAVKDTMVIGCDTYHDSKTKGRSVGAVVTSLNSTFTKPSTCLSPKISGHGM